MIVIGWLIGIVAVGVSLAVGRAYFSNGMRMSSNTEGEVVRAEERVMVDRGVRRVETLVVARFTAIGKDFEVQRVLQGAHAKRFPPGRSVHIRYNPGEPHMAVLAAG